MKQTLSYADNWFFGQTRPEAIGLLRAMCGFYATVNLLLLSLDFKNFFGEKSFFTQEGMTRWLTYPANKLYPGTSHEITLPFSLPRFTLIPAGSSDAWITFIYVVTVACAILFMLGWRSRVTGILLAIGLISLHLRTPVIIHAGDTLLRLFIIYLALGQSSAAYSLDRWIEARKGVAQRLVSIWPQRMIQFQIAICYLMTAWWKWTGSTWMDGTATWYSSQLHEFDRFPAPAFLNNQPFVGITTYGTLLVEVALGTLVFYRPWRKWVLLSGVALHSYIEYSFNIPFFATTIVGGYVAFYYGDEVADWIIRFRKRWLKKGTLSSDAAPEI